MTDKPNDAVTNAADLMINYTDDEIKGSVEAVKGKTELDALVAYLQVLGTAIK